jgi:branched-chain amino acid transport system substrate-binding protein
MIRRMLFAGAASLAVALALAAAPVQAQIKIAVAGPITGGLASFGAQMKAGAEMAVADLNAKGGVLGQQLVLEVGDDACDPKQAVSVANKFAGDGVKFVAGHFCSSSSIPASKVYTEEGILQMTPASTNPKFTDEGSWNTFRTCGRDDQQAMVVGPWLAKEHKNERIAILHDNTTYGKGLADLVRKDMNEAGKKEDLYQAIVPGEHDYTAVVSRLKEAKIDVIYIGGYHPEIGLIAKQSREQGLKASIVGPDSINTKELWQISGPAAEGLMFTFAPDPQARPTAAAVVKEFKDKGIEPEGYTLYTYAAIQVWSEAATKAGTVDPKKVAETLRGGAWDSVLDKLSFDKKGDRTTADYVWYMWHDGDYHQM